MRFKVGRGEDGVSSEEGIGAIACGGMDASRVKIREAGKGVGTYGVRG